jgi:pimeloyl-ACP methyl ester carboxylesterase
MWSYQIEALAPKYRVIAPDLPGFGQSPPMADPSKASLAAWADLLAHLIIKLDLGRVHVVGLSMGGYLAMEFLRSHADLAGSVVLADTRPTSDDSDVWQRRTDEQAQIRAGDPLENLAKPLSERLLSQASLARPELVEYVRQLMVANHPDGWIAALEAMKNRSDSLGTLKALDLPTLVVVGERDRVTPLVEAHLIQSLITDAELVEIPDAGHLPAIENPDVFDQVLIEFLDRIIARDDPGTS